MSLCLRHCDRCPTSKILFCIVAARLKRSATNSDDQLSDGQQQPSTPSQKKPRVFFTELQKAALREAFQRDSYPNQTTLERLASELGVGTKTVVNWFHNHRMRAKQQQQVQQLHSYLLNLKKCDIERNELEDLAADRSGWRSLCKDSVQQFEADRVQCLQVKRTQRKSRSTPDSTDFECDICGRVRASRIRLYAHRHPSHP